jgi:hypothetical protein
VEGLDVLVTSALQPKRPLSFGFAAGDAASLLDRYQGLTQKLTQNAFHRPIYLESTESQSSLKGDIYAVVDYPFAVVNGKLNDPVRGPANWCDRHKTAACVLRTMRQYPGRDR